MPLSFSEGRGKERKRGEEIVRRSLREEGAGASKMLEGYKEKGLREISGYSEEENDPKSSLKRLEILLHHTRRHYTR